MKKAKKLGKIAQAILAEVASKSREADSDEEDITRAKVVAEDEENLGNDETWNLDFEEAPRSKLRTKNVQLLSDVDARYGGKKTSRKKLKAEYGDVDDEKEQSSAELGFMFEVADDEDEEGESDDQEEDEEDEDSEGGESDEEREEKSFKFDTNGTEVDYGAFGENDDDDGDDLSSDGAQSDSEEGEDEEGEAVGGQTILRQDLKSEMSKGMAIKQQLSNWDGLFECRIQIQKILTKINQYPQPNAWSSFTTPVSSADEGVDGYLKTVKKAQTSLANLLDSLIELRVNLINQNPEIRAAVTQNKNKRSRNSDDDEADLEEIEEDGSVELPVPSKKMKLRQYEDLLSSDHESLKSFRNSTIEKWNDKTRLATGHLKSKSFVGFESSTLLQIEHILADKSRLIKRTQLKRSAYTILGQKCSDASDDEGDKEYDAEVFDDDDFYHQLLRELIERKTEGVTDPLLLGQKWLQIQKMRNKIKKKVDTKASKGRKTRFDIHSKLVNFMAPVYIESVLSEDAKTELFKSLFGKTSK